MADGPGAQGRDWLRWPLLAVMALAFGRALVLTHGRRRLGESAFGWYLAGVGFVTVAAYIASRPAGPLVERYLVLSLLIPVGVTAAYLAVEHRSALRSAMVLFVLFWASLSAYDHVSHSARFWRLAPADELRAVIDALLERRISVAESGYWRAYKITFLARERVKVASTDVVRIDEYQRLAAAAGNRLVVIRDRPCAGGEAVGSLYLCPPGQ
jgi:hypothetical protein